MIANGSAQLNIVPRISIFPNVGLIGNFANIFPRGVNSELESKQLSSKYVETKLINNIY